MLVTLVRKPVTYVKQVLTMRTSKWHRYKQLSLRLRTDTPVKFVEDIFEGMSSSDSELNKYFVRKSTLCFQCTVGTRNANKKNCLTFSSQANCSDRRPLLVDEVIANFCG
jgi:hypothetical protein